MAITKISVIPGRSSEWSWQGGRTYRVTFKVETDNNLTGPAEVMKAFGWKYGDVYNVRGDSDVFAFLQSVSLEEDAPDGKTWKVTATYGPFNAAEQASPDNNPLHEQPQISWGFRDLDRVITVDYQGNQILNTAYEPFDPPITEPMSIPVLTINRNEPIGTYSPALAYTYRNAVNSDVFAGEDPGKCKVLQISGKREYHATCGWYFGVTYEFEFNPDGFTRKIPSMGFRQLDASGTKLVQCISKGSPVSSPVLLDKKGRWIQNPQTPPYIMEFQTRPQLSFAIFNFDERLLTGQI